MWRPTDQGEVLFRTMVRDRFQIYAVAPEGARALRHLWWDYSVSESNGYGTQEAPSTERAWRSDAPCRKARRTHQAGEWLQHRLR